MKPLRFFLGLAGLLLLIAAGVGAAMSVKINWEFAKTLGRDPTQGFYIAMTLAAIEVSRILMPFTAKGLELLEMPNKVARVTFWVFTAISVCSATGYFGINRADATSHRATEVSLSRGYQADLAAVTKGIERNSWARSVAEVEAELKAPRLGAADRAKLEAEKAAAEALEADRARLKALSATRQWNTAVSSADAQAELVASALPFDKDATMHVVAALMIGICILALELLVGRMPFAAIMLLVYALRRPEGTAAPASAEVKLASPPSDHVQRFLATCIVQGAERATQWKELYGAYLKFCGKNHWQPINDFYLRRDLQLALGKSRDELIEKRRDGSFWKSLGLKPQWIPEGVSRAA